jgi:hypothetical protein
MGFNEMLDRVRRAFSPPPPYERSEELERAHQVIGDQKTEIERLRQMAEDEERARQWRRG